LASASATRPCPNTVGAPLTPGTRIGDTYLVDHLLGRGAMAEVYAANDIRLGRRLAIKLSKPGFSPEFLESEGRLLGSIRHPGVVSIHDIGDHGGRTYLVLERLFGTTLQRQIDLRRGEPFPIDTALEMLIQLCDVVDVLHRIGVIHRDLKPDNVMATPGGRLVLFDLGVAIGRVDGFSSDVIAGTPAYLAPELLADHPATPTFEQDVYALGCLAYQLLSGGLPFGGQSTGEIFRAHLEQPIPALPPDIDAGRLLRDVVAAMLDKNPERRPGSAAAIASWLRGVQRGRGGDSEEARTSVLIVDDDGDVRALLGSIIEQRIDNVEVRTAVDGLDALDQVNGRPPSIMLLDLEMPRLSGIELCMHLTAIPAASDMLMCVFSGRADPADRSLLRELGVHRFIDKAAPADRIIAAIERLVADVELRRTPSLAYV
jgi:serine/threonine-protein kinase